MISDQDYKQFTLTRIVATLLLVVAPVLYLTLAQSLVKDLFEAEEQATLIMCILLPVATLDPLLWYVIRRIQVPLYKSREEQLGRAKLYFSLMMIKLALVAASFVYGLVVFFLTNDLMNMIWFYIIGFVWSVLFWPRMSHFERVMNDGLEVM